MPRPDARRLRPVRIERRGTVLVAIIALILVAELAIIGLALNLARQQHLAVDRLETVRAFYAAEAGINMALREIAVSADEDSDGGIGSISDDSDVGTDPAFGHAGVSVAVTERGLLTTLVSTGYAADSARKTSLSLMPGTDGTTPGLLVYRFSNVGSVSSISGVDWEAMPAELAVITLLNQPESGSSDLAWPGGPSDDWGQRYVGSVTVAESGNWTFYTESSDGSQLWVNGTLVVDNDGIHALQTRSGSIALTAGMHDFEVKWFDNTGSHGLVVSWSGPGVATQTVIPAAALTY